jgi:hypothetical protein
LEVSPDEEVDNELEGDDDNNDDDDDDDDDDDTDLLSHLQRLFSRSMCVCTPHHEQKVSYTSFI